MNYMAIGTTLRIIKRLGYPHKSNCHNYEPEFRSQKHCINECVLKRGIETLGVIPYSVMYTEASDIPLAYGQLDNQTLRAALETLDGECSKQCPRPDCYELDHTPHVVSVAADSNILLSFYASTRNVDTFTEVVTTTLVDTIVLLIGCFEFYFGVGVLDILLALLIYAKFCRNRAASNHRSQDLPETVLDDANRHQELEGRIVRLENLLASQGQAVGELELRHRQPVAEVRIDMELDEQSTDF